jgi:hypothetical protein
MEIGAKRAELGEFLDSRRAGVNVCRRKILLQKQ